MAAAKRPAWLSLITWLRVVLPPWWALATFVLGLAGCELFAHWFELFPGNQTAEQVRILSKTLHAPRDIWLAVALIGYGQYRVRSMHPFYQADYADWLRTTPWKVGLPLPLGPVQLVPQDGLLFLMVWLISLDRSWLNFHALVAFALVAYLLLLLPPLRIMGATAHTYLIAYGLVFAAWLRFTSPAATLVLVGLYIVALHGLPVSLRAFADPKLGDERLSSWSQLWSKKHVNLARHRLIAFPLAQLSPRPEFAAISVRESLLVAWLAAAGVYAMSSYTPNNAEASMVGCFAAVGGVTITACLRALVYFVEYHPPISLLGRLATRRWIISGYDVAWLPIGYAVLIALALTQYMLQRPERAYVGPLTLGIGLTLVLALPPRLKDWALTGNHRIAANAFRRSEFIEI